MIDKDMLEAMRSMLDERDQKIRIMIQEELEPIKSDVSSLKSDVADLKTAQAEQIEFERGTRILVENVNKNIRLLAEGHGANAAKLQTLDRMEMTLNDVKSDTEVLKSVVSWHSDALKKA